MFAAERATSKYELTNLEMSYIVIILYGHLVTQKSRGRSGHVWICP
jgi:hypothetical protein